MQIIFKWIADYLLGKIVPVIVNFITNLFKKKKIDIEVDEEEDEIQKIREEIWEYLQRTGDDRVPKHLEDKFRAALNKRNRDL